MPLFVVAANLGLSGSLARSFREDGYEVETAATGAAALRRLERGDIDAMILGLALPDLDGMSVLAQTRARGMHAPVLVLAAGDGVLACVTALERGADDYLPTPFVYEELRARIRALLRRAAAPRWAPLSCNGLVVRDDDLTVSIRGAHVPLSPREHALLTFLLRRKGEVVSRPQILQNVFGYPFEPGTNLVNVHIAHLRRKIGLAAVCIETVRGFGYRLRAATPGDAASASVTR